jgi:tetratricopeptide (TPR) repeat protein
MQTPAAVRVWTEDLVIPTYLPSAPDKNPMFVEKRVYQGSSGKVYPLPFTDRIAAQKTDRKWRAIWLENDFIRVLVLPEIGGRIHVLQDKTNGYDAIYRQAVIKPALVGLAGPWISGGIEFNWPQHHRPATFMPVDSSIEEHADGSRTVWCSDHDPMVRMKGMHGVCLHPDKAWLELKVRAYNRTPLMQTFLWWANVATRVHEDYQSFFPPDVHYVADHAKRAMSEYPLCKGFYYGVDYARRGRNGVPAAEQPAKFVPPHGRYAPNDLSWYANIPTPCSYMAMDSKEDFFGGYDHQREAGLIHFANHHIAPGKKQWTWGNHEFGYAWDRNLTDPDEKGECAPYIELMSGVFTDNQPDFSFLMPGETKTWSQYWYPIQKIGPAQKANLDAALSLNVANRKARVGISAAINLKAAVVRLAAGNRMLGEWSRDLAPGQPLIEEIALPPRVEEGSLRVSVRTSDGREIISYEPGTRRKEKKQVPPAATEPVLPAAIATSEELYLTGLHLVQYRHATRAPEIYWREAVRRDPGDSRCLNALGLWHLRRGEFTAAERHFRAALRRLTRLNPNPYDGEACYNLGVALGHLGRDDEAYDAFYKATWNHAWQAAGWHALAEIDCRRHNWTSALDHLGRALRANTDNLRARNLRALVLRQLGRMAEAEAQLRATVALDPLDWWATHLLAQPLSCDTHVRLDLALDYAWAGFFAEALDVLKEARPESASGTEPLLEYYRAWLCHLLGDITRGRRHLTAAAKASPDYCFPSRLEEIAILGHAIASNPRDARAPYYLGNLLYDRRRHTEAIKLWEKSARLDGTFAVVWRNLGVGYFNVAKKPLRARAAYDRALRANPDDARLLYERDQLWKRLGRPPAERLRELERRITLVNRRDDLSLELCALHNQTGQPAKALAILSTRKFQPWEGGEGVALGQHVRTHLALGRAALERGSAAEARGLFEAALQSPENLGEARHLLANQSDIHFWLGEACARLGDRESARLHWSVAAAFKGDFHEMRVRAFSEMTYYSARALERLGRSTAARKLLHELLGYARKLARTPARIDYFATSLPTMLMFDDDLPRRQTSAAMFMEAQARLGLGQKSAAVKLLQRVLVLDPNHALAADLLAADGSVGKL